MKHHPKVQQLVFTTAAAIALALTGCSGASTASTTSSAPTKPPTYFGEAASAIATQITDCKEVKTLDVADGPKSGLSSLATCTLDGRLLTVYSWADESHAAGVPEMLAVNNQEAWYASGTGWTAIVQYDDTLMYQLTNQADKLLAAAWGGKSAPPADIPGQKSAADKAVTSLGGKAAHYKP